MTATASPARRSGLARWKRGTAPLHGALVALDVLGAIMMTVLVVLALLNDISWWLSVLVLLAGLGSITTAAHEVYLLRRGEGSNSA